MVDFRSGRFAFRGASREPCLAAAASPSRHFGQSDEVKMRTSSVCPPALVGAERAASAFHPRRIRACGVSPVPLLPQESHTFRSNQPKQILSYCLGTSINTASPWPPPLQIEAIPRPPPRRFSS